MSMLDQVMVRGEIVTIIGPTPSDWTGLGPAGNTDTDADAFLVEYPDGEVGSVPKSEMKDIEA